MRTPLGSVSQPLQMARHYLWGRKGRAFMTLAGIALGVTMVVAVLLLNKAILGSYENLLTAAAGRADLQVSATTGFGFDERLLAAVRETAGVGAAAPVISSGAPVFAGDRQAGATFYGIDVELDQKVRDYRLTAGRLPAADGEAAVTTDLAEGLGLAEGDSFRLLTTQGLKEFRVVGVFDARGTVRGALGPFGVLTLEAAQEAFGKAGRLDVIDVIAAPGESLAALRERLADALDPQVRVTTPAERSRDMEKLLDAVVFLLTVAGSVSLFAGTFIIYTNVSMSVAERRRELSILRALGMRRGEVMAVVLTEAGLLGFLGALAGLANGFGMAWVMAEQMTDQFLNAYGVQRAAVTMDPAALAAALAVGIGAALVAAFGPARETVMVSPMEAMRPTESPGIDRARLDWRRGAAGLALMLAGSLTIWLTWPQNEMVSPPVLRLWGLMLAVLLLGAVLLLPLLLNLLTRAVLRPLLTGVLGVTGRLAADNLIRMPRRTAATVSALMVALTYMVAMGGVEASQMAAFNRWFEKNIGWDMNVSSSYSGIGALVEMDDGFVQQLAEVEGVRLVSPQKMMRVILSDGEQAFMQVFDHRLLRQYSETPLEEGSWPEAADLMEQGGHVIISPAVAARLGLDLGDTLELPSPGGTLTLTVAGIMTDITPYGGTLNIDRRDYLRYWNDATSSNVAVLVEPGHSPEAVRQRILDRWGDTMPLAIRLNHEFWQELKVSYDSFYGLNEALTWIAVLVSGLAIANTLFAAILERKREIGVLRAVGTRRGEVLQVVLGEALSIGLVGGLIGSVAGLTLQRVMVAASQYINGAATEWVVDWGSLAMAAAVALLLAPLAGLLPARWAARLDVVDALRYE